MKPLAALIATCIVIVLSIPLVFANGGPATTPYACGRLGVILDTIRTLESGGDYTVRARGASAAGAYQYITSTWRHWAEEAGVSTDLYPTADTAPPHVQDRVAGVNVSAILADHDNLVEVVPIIWYFPAALGDPETMDRIPRPDAGNTLTVRAYQTRWLDTYNEKVAGVDETVPTCVATDVTGEWALPLPREILTPEMLSAPHHTYPAWDAMVPEGTPVYALTGGRVARITSWTGNWWHAGCGGPRPPADCNTCGVGITIQHPDGLRHTYCHNVRNHVAVGDQIAPGQHIADSGNTGRSGAPHLHLELRINGRRLCPQPLLVGLSDGAPTEPRSLPTSGCSF
ncbi:MAG: M23 family metallopeptidase [Ilumatobacter sp.]|uniref:M23 family metallopeptidase n=1 Tax=Ilumatobacter sp. TaxID=1967498 RepID=UPI0026042673|nr:M23 family metallopeptidase [Ilumatobacter sp.]MDJ0771684.1 M23 family metallopeptidase [Ilumatobacter sp.]